MKKLLLIFALAAAGLQGWADDFYIVGDATLDGWQGTRTCKMAETSSGSNIYTWTGYLKATSGDTNGFKICNGSSWSAWCASSNQKPIGTGTTEDTPQYYNDDVNPKTGSDNKWKVNTNGYYELKLDLAASTKKFTAKLLVPTNAEGTICRIGSSDDLNGFATLVNDNGNTSLKAELTNNITATNYSPIGTDTNKYNGTFDGKEHSVTLSIDKKTTNNVGLFGVVQGGVNISNVITKGYVNGKSRVAGIVGSVNGTGNVTISNCGNEATITTYAGANGAGIVGVNMSSSASITIENCYNKGDIIGNPEKGIGNPNDVGTASSGENGAICGWLGDLDWDGKACYVKNCYNTGEVKTWANTDKKYNSEQNFVRRNRGNGNDDTHLPNNYNIKTNITNNRDAVSDGANNGVYYGKPITSEQVPTGELCYMLNDNQNTINWYQNLNEQSEDSFPVPFSTSKQVRQANEGSFTNLAVSDSKAQIGNADDLKQFSLEVNNGGHVSTNAQLTADIDLSSVTDWWPIGSDGYKDYKYKGDFDGNGKTVTLGINNTENENQGLFGIVTGGAKIHDLIVAGFVTAKAKVAGVIGMANDGGQVYLTNVINLANIRSTGDNLANAAGLVGCAANNTALIVTNCANMGNVSGQEGQCSGLAGWTEDYNGLKSLFINCWNSGTISNMENNCNLYRNTSKVDATNCYDVSGNTSYTQGTKLDNNSLTSGELCYKLNGDQKEIGWYQNLIGTTDTYPVPFSSHSQVYPNAAVNCDGSSVSGSALGYTNTNTYSAPAHNYEDGWCTICNAYQENGITATNDWYEIGNAKQLRWMVESVNKHYNTYKSAKIKLTDDIDYSAYKNEDAMFGFEYHTYKGTFDGQCHAVTVDFEASESETGLFRRVNGGTIKNLKVEGNIETTKQFAGGIVAGIWEKGTITNCVSAVTLTDTNSGHDGTHGGILGWVNSVNDITVSNCLFIGEIDAPNTTGCTGVVGWTADKETEMKVKNCLVLGTLNLKDVATNGIIVRSKANTTGNYYICTVGSSVKKDGGTDASAHNNTPGELCYYINGSTPYNTEWRQNLGTTADDTPVPFYTHGIVNKISAVGYTTQYISTTDVTIPAGVEAYAGEINGDRLRLVEIEDAISKNDAVVLKGNEGYYSFLPTTGASKATNDLLGSDGNVPGGDGIYALSTLGGTAPVGFYPLTDTNIKIPAGKAYLNLSGSTVKAFTFVFDDDATGLDAVNGEGFMVNGPIFNLAGQRIQKMQKGINIVNGKKVMVK